MTVLFITIIVLISGLYLAFNIGANDVANNVSTSVGSKSLNIKQAIVLAGIFEFLGAFFLGDQVTKTIKQGFVSPEVFAQDPMGFAYGMTAAIIATSLWLQYATIKGLPVSTTHSIVGAVLGFAIVQGGFFYIKYKQLLFIFFSWIFSPVLGALISYVILRIILKFIIDNKNPIKMSKIFLPIIVSIMVFVLSLSFTKKVFLNYYMLFSFLFAFISWAVFFVFAIKINYDNKKRRMSLFKVEGLFAKAQVVTACFLSFAHGSNDVANAIGPASAVLSVTKTSHIDYDTQIPSWLMFLGAIGIVAGLIVFGRSVIKTIGQNITQITPTRGFSAEVGACFTILFGSVLGLPLSSTHVLVGSVIGVGLARGINGIDLQVIKKIGRSWIITMPFTAMLSMLFCFLLKLI